MFGRFLLARLLVSVVSVSLLSATAAAQTTGYKRPKPPARICVGENCVISTGTSGKIKWNPGHYMASESILRSSGDLVNLNREMSNLKGHPGVVGYRVLTTWGAIEKGRGQYDFSLLDQVMRTLKSGLDSPKQLVLVILPGTFSGGGLSSSNSAYLPLYLQQDRTNGPSPSSGSYGWWGYSGGGYIAALHRAPVMDRYIALMNAVGAHFDGDPNFEGIMIQEDAWIAQRLAGAPDYNTNGGALMTQLQRLLTAMTTSAFPHTSVIMQATYLGTQGNSTAFEAWMVANRVVPSAADTVGQSALNSSLSSLGWGLQAYVTSGTSGTSASTTRSSAVPDLRAQSPTMMDVEAFDIVGNYYQKQGGPFTPQDILEALNKTYQASHAFWTYLAGTEVYRGGTVPAETKWSSLAPFLDSHPLVRASYPTIYP